MKLILYSNPNCEHSLKIKNFLKNNNLPFKEIIVDNEEKKKELKKLSYQDEVSSLEIIKSHGIEVMVGFNEWHLNQLIEHIKKYNSKVYI